jgi:integrase
MPTTPARSRHRHAKNGVTPADRQGPAAGEAVCPRITGGTDVRRCRCSINTLVDTVATLLDVAMERSDVELTVNAARGRWRKLKVVQPKLRSFLEVDQVWALLDAAAVRERRISANRPGIYPGRVILSLLALRGLRISELCTLERGLVNLGVDVIQTSRSTTAEGYLEIDIIFAALHDDLEECMARPTRFGRARAPLIPAGKGRRLAPSNLCLPRSSWRQTSCCAAVASRRPWNAPPHTLRRTYISLLLAARQGAARF